MKVGKYRPFGLTLNFLHLIHWFQFADDAGQESENLSNIYRKSSLTIIIYLQLELENRLNILVDSLTLI